MHDELLEYYERELTYIRKSAADFASKYDKIAKRLQIEPTRCEDPHTERLIEAFAFISGRILKKVDDGLPEITESLMNVAFPHYNNPVPSMTIVQFEPKSAIENSGLDIPTKTQLHYKHEPDQSIPECIFETRYPVQIWPVLVDSARFRDPQINVKSAQKALVLQLKTDSDQDFSEIPLNSLRFFLDAPTHNVYSLYELLLNNVCHVICELKDENNTPIIIPLTPDDIKPVGFSSDEYMMPYSSQSFPGYRLLTEYFSFPEKFLFFDLTGLDKIRNTQCKNTLSIWFYLNKNPKKNLTIDQNTFVLHAAPAINLFDRIVEPIYVEQRKTEYRVIPDIGKPDYEVYSIDKVTAALTDSPDQIVEYKPLYSVNHYINDESPNKDVFWNVRRQLSEKKGDIGTEVYLSFSTKNYKPVDLGVEVVVVQATCSNRNWPAKLPFGKKEGDFETEDTETQNLRISNLIKPTSSHRPFLEGSQQWRLISHFSLNYLSLLEDVSVLKEILNLYDFEDSSTTKQQINGIVSIKTKRVTKNIGDSFCRGIQFIIEFDEEKFVGTGLFLLASVLECFLGHYVSINSFTQVIARTIQKKEVLKEWNPRNGYRILV